MPNAILVYSLPDEEYEYRNAQKANDAQSAIREVLSIIRHRMKHESPPSGEAEILERIRSELLEGVVEEF